ncbi:hypothetical protein GOODEAATRI_003376, partial [Goodea atripinnis]
NLPLFSGKFVDFSARINIRLSNYFVPKFSSRPFIFFTPVFVRFDVLRIVRCMRFAPRSALSVLRVWGGCSAAIYGLLKRSGWGHRGRTDAPTDAPITSLSSYLSDQSMHLPVRGTLSLKSS